MVTGMASKKVECGATVRMGASEDAARSPLTLIQWKPPQNHIALINTRKHTSINLMQHKHTDKEIISISRKKGKKSTAF